MNSLLVYNATFINHLFENNIPNRNFLFYAQQEGFFYFARVKTENGERTFSSLFLLNFSKKSPEKKHHLTREVMKTTPFPILLGLLLASGLCMVWTNMVLKIRSPTLKTYKMKILSVRLSLTGIFKTTITFFSLTSK